jgi:peptidoglycan/xylan/chitin deacetylase (PgdA/CDA1 family)
VVVEWTVLWLILLLVCVYDLIPVLMSRVLKFGVYHVGPKRNAVSLTFDDGPDPTYTPLLLDVLRDCGVRASFFVIGAKAVRYPGIIQRMMEEGHDIQVHGWTHLCVPFLGIRKSQLQVKRTSDELQAQFGVHTTLYRPTWGLINLPAWIAARRTGHRVVTWSIMVGDWRITASDVLQKRVTDRIHQGAVIVLHDSDETPGAQKGAPSQVIQMIPSLTKVIRDLGYEFEPLSSWVATRNHIKLP